MGSISRWVCLLGFASLLAGEPAKAAISGLQQVAATGLGIPAFATYVPGDDNRLFVADLGGGITIVNLNSNTVTGTFLDITDADPQGEGGLLGLAFHPNYSNEGMTGFGKFYVYVTIDNPVPEEEETFPFSSHIREYSVDPNNPNLANPASVNEVLSFTQPQDNHNGGWIGFSPNDGYLYIASGDGGNGLDSGPGHSELPDAPGNAQDLTNNFLGKMLRIDVNSDAFPADETRDYANPADNPFRDTVDDMGMPVVVPGDDEIWAYGLRNPFRDSFDRLTGDLWIGDVGESQREEVDYQPANSAGGENYGWRFREGTFMTNGGVGGPDSPAYTGPIYDYGRGDGDFLGETVIGGYAYRGPDPDLQGRYFFGDADSSNDNVWVLDLPNPVAPVTSVDNINTELGSVFNDLRRIGSFGEDNKGNLYIVDLFGRLYRILTDNLLAGDYNADGNVDDDDYNVWKTNFGATSGAGLVADGNDDNVVNAADFTVWRDNLGNSVHDLGAGSGGVSVPEPAATALFCQVLGLLLLSVRRRGRIDGAVAP